MSDYVETRALEAMLGENETEAQRLVEAMLPGERRDLAAACYRLADIAVPPSAWPI